MEKPSLLGEMFVITAVLIFLAINYNLPLGTIYFTFAILSLVLYLAVIQFNFFKWLPFSKNGNLLTKMLTGAGFGYAFMLLYNQISTTPMAAVFATTVFGDSEILTKGVYSSLIPWQETIFFFFVLLQFWVWSSGESIHIKPFSKAGFKWMALLGGVFTIFHAAAKGVLNTPELAATMIFGMLTVGMILYFQELIQAFSMHVVLNAKAMGLFASLSAMTNTWVIYLAAGGAAYYLMRSKRPLFG